MRPKITFPDLGRMGRLGNQLHQIAATFGIGQTHGMRAQFPENWKYRPYFSIPDESFGSKAGTPAYEFYNIDIRHRGYLQDYSLWRDIAYWVKICFQPSLLAKEILFSYKYDWYHSLIQKVSLHVRRGDNVGRPDLYPMPSLNYYKKALEQVPDWPVVVFSDDIPWCKETLPREFPEKQFYYFEGIAHPKEDTLGYSASPAHDWIDLFLMTYADVHVISNSSYSWWGAYLSNDPVLVYPSVWWGPKIMEYADPTLMFVEPRWRKVDSR